ncbi:hypothetical protein [Stetteria hydrogenophila]
MPLQERVYEDLHSLLSTALESVRKASRLAKEEGIPSVMLPLRTMIIPVLKEIVAQLDGYRNDFPASDDVELWPRIGSYAGGRVDFKVVKVRWEEV